MLALVKNNPVLNRLEIVNEVAEGGWFALPDGSMTSPAVDGWELRGYELRTIVDADPVPEGFYITGKTVEIVGAGPKYVNQIAPAVPVVPEEISRRQFFQVLANREMITKEEALAAVTTGALPAVIEAIIGQIIDSEIQWQVRMSFAALTFNRRNWCVDLFAAMQGMSSAATDGIWIDGALLD